MFFGVAEMIKEIKFTNVGVSLGVVFPVIMGRQLATVQLRQVDGSIVADVVKRLLDLPELVRNERPEPIKATRMSGDKTTYLLKFTVNAFDQQLNPKLYIQRMVIGHD